jgi:adenylate cyclase
MFTDMVGSTAAAQTNEEEALRLGGEQEKLVRRLFAAHQGREIKSMGDGFLAEFDSALRAVECAIDIQQHLRTRNSASGVTPIRLRIGIHLGDVERRGSDIFGDAVNIASRIEPLASPGGVCISGEVFSQVRNKIPNQLDKLPPTPLKGLKVSVDLYRVVLPWESPRPDPEKAGPPRIAVLPLANISPDPKDEYFADGLTEELIGALSKLRDLQVIARTSVGRYKFQSKSVSQIGSELGVSWVLEGSVRKAGNRLRITLQLVNASTEAPVWADTYDRELDDVFAIQTEVATKVAGSLARGVFARRSENDTTEVDAYLSYLRAIQHLHEDTVESLREAVRLFEQAIQEDPSFGRAYAGLARTWEVLVMHGSEDYEIVGTKAEGAARKALELAPDSAEAHAALAEVHGLLDRFAEGVAEAQRAIEINPNLSEAYETLGRQQTMLKGLEVGLPAFRKAHELDPLGIRPAVVLAWVAQLAGHEDEARDVLERMDRLSPGNPTVCDGLGEYYRLKGDFSKARKALDRGLKDHPDDEALRVDVGVLCAMSGKRKEAEQILREVEGFAGEAGRLNARLFIRAALGDLDEAFAALSRLAEVHAWPFLLGLHPNFERMRNDPRFEPFRQKLGILVPSRRRARPTLP